MGRRNDTEEKDLRRGEKRSGPTANAACLLTPSSTFVLACASPARSRTTIEYGCYGMTAHCAHILASPSVGESTVMLQISIFRYNHIPREGCEEAADGLCPGAVSPLSQHGGNQGRQTSQRSPTLSVSQWAVRVADLSSPYQDRGRVPEVRSQVVDLAINGSGIRDTARVLRISPTTVIGVLKKSLRASPRHPRAGAPAFTRRRHARPATARRRAG